MAYYNLDLTRATYVLYGVKYIDLVSLLRHTVFALQADSMGWIKQWDIRKYAQTREDRALPIKLDSWHAHRQAITCMILSEESETVISASTDCSIRVWNLKTRNVTYIGSFGTRVRGVYVYVHARVCVCGGGGMQTPV